MSSSPTSLPITSRDARLVLEWAGYRLCAGVGIESASGGFEATTSKMVEDCPVVMKRVRLLIRTTGELVELESDPLPSSGACIGRRPAGFICSETTRGGGALAEHFARIAELEAASVAAFEVIAAELQHYAAPTELIAEARAAAADEVRHARATARLARRFGAVAYAPRIEAQPLRSLEAFAQDNATEGCVRETFGALIGHYQAAAARDPEIAALMREIAEDETRHAALSHRIARWAEPKLSAAAKERVATARGVAVALLFQELQVGDPAADVRALAGVPGAATAMTLLGNMASAILYERG